MGIQVGTIFKWMDPDDADEDGKPVEGCEDGQCVGIVTEVVEPPKSDLLGKPGVIVKFWEKCDFHAEIAPEDTGPYDLRFIWQIGQLY